MAKLLPAPTKKNKTYCGTILLMGRCVDIYETLCRELEAFDGHEAISLNEQELCYLIEQGKILGWNLREPFTSPRGQVIWI